MVFSAKSAKILSLDHDGRTLHGDIEIGTIGADMGQETVNRFKWRDEIVDVGVGVGVKTSASPAR